MRCAASDFTKACEGLPLAEQYKQIPGKFNLSIEEGAQLAADLYINGNDTNKPAREAKIARTAMHGRNLTLAGAAQFERAFRARILQRRQ